jgi:transketolase
MNIRTGHAEKPESPERRRVLANALRVLAMDAVEAAKSGHPGMPMGMADIAEALWRHHLKHNPADPNWPDRDRFVISNGHGSMLLYGLLHLTGYDLPMEELRRFRQWHSKTPGHPEYGVTPGVETTTGPLGQGVANAVGMALAEWLLASEFNQPDAQIVDHRTFAFVGDGCLMEGISHEACALAGTLGLEKLVAFYDDNGISIDGRVSTWFADDTPQRFEAYGWRVIRAVDGHDAEALDRAIEAALVPCGRPTLICCKTIIAWGSPNKADSQDAHGSALGAKEVAATRVALHWDWPPFVIPEDIEAAWNAGARGAERQADWERQLAAYSEKYPTLAAEFRRRMRADLPANFEEWSRQWLAKTAAAHESVASRKASQTAIENLASVLPELLGGSADLTGSNLTNWPGCRPVARGQPGNYLHFGVREFGMSAILSGIALHRGYIPFGGTFLVFSDYARNAIRLAALMRLRTIFVFTHDSIGLGEDGPTHQPIEHAASLRLIPNLDVWRPCDAFETAVAWRAAIERRDGPTCLLLSRQVLPAQTHASDATALIERGGYVLAAETADRPDLVLIATGSEVAIAMEARQRLTQEGIFARVVSMPSTLRFDQQSADYRAKVLPANIPRLAIEAASSAYWYKYVGLEGGVIGLDRFGESAPAPVLFEHFGLTPQKAVDLAHSLLKGRS